MKPEIPTPNRVDSVFGGMLLRPRHDSWPPGIPRRETPIINMRFAFAHQDGLRAVRYVSSNLWLNLDSAIAFFRFNR